MAWNLTQPLKILVAEDNEVNQILIKMTLQQANFEVMMVSNGKEAVEFVHAFPVDLVLMDVQMPVMDGYMATREIRRYRPDLPILALSANAFKEDIEKSIRCGMNAHLSKPFKLEELLGKIATFFPAFHR
jgi:CheY-like chemotaxis protein